MDAFISLDKKSISTFNADIAFFNALTPSRSIGLAFAMAEKYGITHVVMREGFLLKHADLELVYDDAQYRIYRIHPDRRPSDT